VQKGDRGGRPPFQVAELRARADRARGRSSKPGETSTVDEAREVGMNAVVRTAELRRSPTSMGDSSKSWEYPRAVGIQRLSPNAQVRASGSRFRDVYDSDRSLAPRGLSGGSGRFES
jgi:hypothetical protein